MRALPALFVCAASLLATASTADAFCGFYVAPGDQKMFNDATQVVLMRMGTRTVLSMQNNYKGPPEAFAMVIPVPVVLHEGDVKTLRKEVFDHVDTMSSPRLVEYWEQDPCFQAKYEADNGKDMAGAAPPTSMSGSGAAQTASVVVEAKFAVGEYQIVILSAKDSTGLDAWLRAEKYKIPAGAEPLLRPYVEAGMKFFVAKVDPAKVKFDDQQRVALSPLRFHYDSDEFALPIRLGLANSSGTQDLIVNILAPNQRYQVANYPNVTIPTNLDLQSGIKEQFPAFYTALFDRTVEKNPKAVVTEYAWQAVGCDPCPGPTLDPSEFLTLGADVLTGPSDKPTAYYNADFVLTRLHARYGKEISDDLRFKEAAPISGGREVPGTNGKLEEGSKPDSYNNFQGRYAIRHAWTGPLTCDKPRRGIWGGPPYELIQRGVASTGPVPAKNIAFAPRGKVQLASAVLQDVPEIDLRVGASKPTPAPSAPGRGVAPLTTEQPKTKSGCGCATSERNDVLGGALLVGASLLVRRRRRPRGV
jgi:hypothetical protein